MFAVGTCVLLEYGTKRIRSYQVHTVAELVDMEYRLAGTTAVLERIREQEMVCMIEMNCNRPFTDVSFTPL